MLSAMNERWGSDEEVHDEVLHDEIRLVGELIVAAAANESHLPLGDIDAALGLDTGDHCSLTPLMVAVNAQNRPAARVSAAGQLPTSTATTYQALLHVARTKRA